MLEQDIANALSISRGPVREALRQLEQEGLVEYRRNRGCTVRKFEKKDAAEIFFICATLESSAIDHCKCVIPPEVLIQLEEALCGMQEQIEKKSLMGFFREDQLFHGAIVRASGLERLCSIWNSLSTVNIALFLTDCYKNFVLEEQEARHRKILDVLKSGDVIEARNVIYEHYTVTTALNR